MVKEQFFEVISYSKQDHWVPLYCGHQANQSKLNKLESQNIRWDVMVHELGQHIIVSEFSSISNNSVKHKSTKVNGSKYCYVSLTIQLNITGA